jgi:hypothetical protein
MSRRAGRTAAFLQYFFQQAGRQPRLTLEVVAIEGV